MTIQEQIKELKTKLEQQNKEMLDKIAELEKQAKAEEQQSKVWKPKENEMYYYVFDGGVDDYRWTDDDSDKILYAIGNCFKTKEEAEWEKQHRLVATELKHFVLENDPRPITEEDWENSSVYKYFIYYSFPFKRVDWSNDTSGIIANQVYASNKEVLLKAIEHIGEERLKKYYFGVK